MTPTCPEHAGLVEQLRAGHAEFIEIKADQKEIKADPKDIKASVLGGNYGKPCLEQRVSALEDVQKNVNRVAWAIGIPIMLAAVWGAWDFVKLVYWKVR